MNAIPAPIMHDLADQVRAAAASERLQTLLEGGRELVRHAPVGQRDQVHDEIVSVANWLDQQARLKPHEFDAVLNCWGRRTAPSLCRSPRPLCWTTG